MLAATLSTRRSQALLAQFGGALLLVTVLAILTTTLVGNLERLNLVAGFGFLWRPAGMQIGESAIPFAPSDSFAWALLAGLVNTVRVSVAAIVLATVLGTLVGIMRLASNPLLRAITSVYVELFRNVPLLLQILFWSALLLKLPAVRDAIDLGGVYLSKRGLQMPTFVLGTGIEWPVRKGFGYTGGMTLSPEFCALLAGLVAYAGAFIAEIVRGGISAVPQGQWEAARSLGLHNGTILRRVVLPQALRIILPALTSQYTGIIKNSSLAIAIGYPDLFWAVSTAINVTGHAVEGVALLMGLYLVLTLGISGAMNAWYRRMLAQ
jgi:general L-amino acid transport system permease protein